MLEKLDFFSNVRQPLVAERDVVGSDDGSFALLAGQGRRQEGHRLFAGGPAPRALRLQGHSPHQFGQHPPPVSCRPFL